MKHKRLEREERERNAMLLRGEVAMVAVKTALKSCEGGLCIVANLISAKTKPHETHQNDYNSPIHEKTAPRPISIGSMRNLFSLCNYTSEKDQSSPTCGGEDDFGIT